MKNKTLIMLSALLFVSTSIVHAQGESKNTKPGNISKKSKVEIFLSASQTFSSSAESKFYQDNYGMSMKAGNGMIYSLGAGYNITRNITAGIAARLHKWDITNASLYSGPNRAYSVNVFGNYKFPVGRSAFYAGFLAGYLHTYDKSGEWNRLPTGSGYDFNVHVGYKLPLVRNRLFASAEVAYNRSAVVKKETIPYAGNHREENVGYSISSFSAGIGLHLAL